MILVIEQAVKRTTTTVCSKLKTEIKEKMRKRGRFAIGVPFRRKQSIVWV